MTTSSRRFHRRAALCALLVVLLAGCAAGPARQWLNAPGWSRATAVARSAIAEPASLVVDDDGAIYVFTVAPNGDGGALTLVALDDRGEPGWSRSLDVTLERPRQLHLTRAGAALILHWIDSSSAYTAQISRADGRDLLPPTLISADLAVDTLAVAQAPDGRTAVWMAGSRRAPGLFRLPDEGGAPRVVDPRGVRPALQFDAGGDLHAAYAYYPPGESAATILYGEYQAGVIGAESAVPVLTPGLSTTSILGGPWLGLDDSHAYIFWNINFRTGPRAGAITASVMALPHGQTGSPSQTVELFLPTASELDYAPASTQGYQAGPRLVDWSGRYPTAARALQFAPLSGAGPEFVVAFQNNTVAYQLRNFQPQIATLYFRDGAATGYQLISFAPRTPRSPALAADAAGMLYLTWLERVGAGTFDVMLASSAPPLIAAWTDLTAADLIVLVRETFFGLATGLVLAPIVGLLWLMAALLALAPTAVLRRAGESGWALIGHYISAAVAVGAYWVAKLLTLPGIRSYVPFSAWLPNLPEWLHLPLRFGLPALFTAVALYVAWDRTYRRHNPTALFFVILFVTIDAVLTLSVYGFLFYNIL